ncbi:ficolin-2-like [Haematobia irritans]|uniref:ficolin-2-like n=1 Tax=Haematobia irritans TaxID=7368 RepID=UPI003F50546E
MRVKSSHTKMHFEGTKILHLMLILYSVGFCTSTNSDAVCNPHDEETIGQWFGQVTQFVQANQHVNRNVLEILDNYKDLDKRFMAMEEKLDKCLKTTNELVLTNKPDSNIVIQRRMDGSIDFYRTWDEYKIGFGNSSGEFFIGLEKLHQITTSRPHELLIVMEDWEGDRRLALYDFFTVGSEAQKYPLLSLGTYSGSAGDALSYHLGQKFSTKDQDNDVHTTNCAVDYTGAWWHKNCHHSNLNGRYLKGTTVEYAQGINWYQFKGHHYSMKFVEMILRPR